MIKITPCASSEDFSSAMEITRAYIDWLDLDLGFQDIDSEFTTFDKMYGPPEGMFLLCHVEGELAGGVGLRKLGDDICEMKRLYVYPQHNNKGVGKALCFELIRQAKDLGYTSMRLDTLVSMNAAQGLYKSFGFKEIEAYRFNPDPGAIYMELVL